MGLPQREGRETLSILPEESDFYNKDKFNEKLDASSCGETFDNLGAIELNHPVEQRKGKMPNNGWMTVASDIYSEGDNFSKGSGGEER